MLFICGEGKTKSPWHYQLLMLVEEAKVSLLFWVWGIKLMKEAWKKKEKKKSYKVKSLSFSRIFEFLSSSFVFIARKIQICVTSKGFKNTLRLSCSNFLPRVYCWESDERNFLPYKKQIYSNFTCEKHKKKIPVFHFEIHLNPLENYIKQGFRLWFWKRETLTSWIAFFFCPLVSFFLIQKTLSLDALKHLFWAWLVLENCLVFLLQHSRKHINTN